MSYQNLYNFSINSPESFWKEEAERVFWKEPFKKVLDYSEPPFTKWFVGGRTNLCFNTVDRWISEYGDSPALISYSSETRSEKIFSFKELKKEIEIMSGIFLSFGIKKGDMVLIYMPMIAEAIFAILACARIGAIHSVVFGGFASSSLASRIEDSKPKIIVSADAGIRSGKVIPYKPLLDQAIEISKFKPNKILLVDRALYKMDKILSRDYSYYELKKENVNVSVPITWLNSEDISYILYTSGTTGLPKGVQRDVGGYSVALASSMNAIFCGKPGDTFFCTSDIGWVVGHSYIIYGPLIAGMTTILYEGLPIIPDAGVWWKIVEKFQVNRMFTAPTAIRVLQKYPVDLMHKYDITSLKALYLAGEPLDESTSEWISKELNVDIIDNYWQTETGTPVLSVAKGIENSSSRVGSPGVPMLGYKIKLLNEVNGNLCNDNEKGVLVIEGPLPPGFMQTIFRDDKRYIKTYWKNFTNQEVYSTFDWGIRDNDGYYYILGRTDDVINVSGHRLGTREIEEVISSHQNVSEVAVIGVNDKLKGQVAVAFVIPKQNKDIDNDFNEEKIKIEIKKLVEKKIGSFAKPYSIYLVNLLPKTRSGKLLRRSIQAVYEERDPGDLPTIEDPNALNHIKASIK